jgi:IS1 family transposase
MTYILSERKQLEVLKLLIESGSINSVSRLTGVHRGTIRRLLIRFGEGCRRFLDVEMRDLKLAHVQCDEIYTWCYKKQKTANRQNDTSPEVGEFYLYVAMDESSRLIPAFRLDKKNDVTTELFITDLYGRLRDDNARPHDSDAHAYKPEGYVPITRISTDAYGGYERAIKSVFGKKVEYGYLTKNFQTKNEVDESERPKPLITKSVVEGTIDEKSISTSLIERSNLTTRHFVKRLGRRTICFSKKVENFKAALAIHFAVYNYCWSIKTLRKTPAMAAGIVDKKWSHADLYEHIRAGWPDLFFEKSKKISA